MTASKPAATPDEVAAAIDDAEGWVQRVVVPCIRGELDDQKADAVDAICRALLTEHAEAEAMRHDITRLYDSLNGEANARIAAEARVLKLRQALLKIERQTSPAETVCSQWSINTIARDALAAGGDGNG